MGAQAMAEVPALAGRDLTVDLLGPVRVRRGDTTIALAPSQRRLAAALAVHRETGATSGWLAAATGAADPDGEAARRSLRTAVWRLRAKVGDDVLVAERGRYRLAIGPDGVDLDRFVRLSERGRQALVGGDAGPARSSLRAALELWRGPMLADAPLAQPLPPLAAGAEALRRDVVELVAEASLATGAAAEVLSELEAAVAEHPTRERAWTLLVEAHLALENTGAARQVADRAVAALAGVGLEPSPPLRAAIDRATGTPSAAAASPTPLAGWISAARAAGPLFGRDDELSALEQATDAMLRSRAPAGLVVVAGEPGIGKTRLVAEVATRAEHADVQVLADRADPLDPAPYQGIAALVRGFAARAPAAAVARARAGPLRPLVDPDAPPRDRPEDDQVAERQGLFGALTELAAAAVAEQPTLAIVDDLHWCDADGVQLLLHVLRARPDLPLVLLATARSTEPGAATDPTTLAGLASSTTWIQLEGLAPEAVARLVEHGGPSVSSTPGGAAASAGELHRVTGGNPLFVRHVLAAGGPAAVAGPAPGLAQAVERHLASLDPDTRAVLDEAAVQGVRFRVDLLRGTGVADLTTALDRAEEAELVHPDPEAGALHFAHPVVQASLLAGLSRGRRAEHHLHVARALEHEAPDGAGPLLTIARHFHGAAPLVSNGPVVRYATAAAERAEQALDFALAARAWHLGASAAAPDEATELLLRAAAARVAAGELAEASDEIGAAAEAARETNERSLRAHVAITDATLAMRLSSTLPTRTRALLDRAMIDTQPGPQLAELAMFRALDRASDESVATRLRATAPDQETLAVLAQRAYWFAGAADRLELCRLLGDLTPTLDRDLRAMATVVRWIEEVARGVGHLDRAPEGAFDPREEGEPSDGYPGWVWWLWAATRAQGQGRFEEATALAHRAHASASVEDVPRPARRNHAAVAFISQLVGLRALTEPVPPPTETPDPASPMWTDNVPMDRAAGVARAMAMGNQVLARERLRATAALLDDPANSTEGSWPFQVGGMLYIAIILGELDQVDALAARLRARTGEHIIGRMSYYYGSVDLAVGLAELRLGRHLDAVDRLERSVDQHRAVGSPVYEAHSLGALAAALRLRGHSDDRARGEAAAAESTRLAADLNLSLRPLAFLQGG